MSSMSRYTTIRSGHDSLLLCLNHYFSSTYHGLAQTSVLTETPLPFWTFTYSKMTVTRLIVHYFTRARYSKALCSTSFCFHLRHLFLLYLGLSIIDIRRPSMLADLSIFATSSKISFTRFSRSTPACLLAISLPLNITVTFNLSPFSKNF